MLKACMFLNNNDLNYLKTLIKSYQKSIHKLYSETVLCNQLKKTFIIKINIIIIIIICILNLVCATEIESSSMISQVCHLSILGRNYTEICWSLLILLLMLC